MRVGGGRPNWLAALLDRGAAIVGSASLVAEPLSTAAAISARSTATSRDRPDARSRSRSRSLLIVAACFRA